LRSAAAAGAAAASSAIELCAQALSKFRRFRLREVCGGATCARDLRDGELFSEDLIF